MTELTGAMFVMKPIYMALLLFASAVHALERLPYNNPGLVVDLGVGLWAWPVPCDADGDGDYDLIVSCPDKPSNGVWLFENAVGDTATNKLPVFKAARRLSHTQHYVMPSWVDGKLRVLTPGQEHPNFERAGLAQRVKLPVDARFYKPRGTARGGPRLRHNQWRYADYDGDGRADLIVGIEDWSYYGWDDAYNERGEWTNGPLHGFVHVFRNTALNDAPDYADPFLVQAGDAPLDTFGCPSPTFADFNHDNDLDLLCGEFLDRFTYFENIGTRTQPRYSKGKRLKDAAGADVRMELQMIVPVAFDWDKDGDADLITGDEDGRVAFVENVSRGKRGQAPVFAQPVYFKQEADTLKCGALATPVGADWDGDGDTDIVSGNTAGFVEIFENLSGPGVAYPKWAAPRRLHVGGKPFRIMAGPNGSIQGPAEAKWGYTTLSVADWDVDFRPDIVLNSILGEVVWLRNIGKRDAPVFAGPQPIEVEWDHPQPALAWGWRKPQGRALLTQWRTTPVVHDFNRDGLPDLAMLDQEGYLAFFQRTKREGKLLLAAPRRAFVDEQGAPLRLNAGVAGKSGRRKLCVADWDGDGQFDFLLNSSNADLLRQVSEKDGIWTFKNAGTLARRNIEGHDVSPAVVDFDGDGTPDFLGGAEDGRFYFMANPRSSRAALVLPVWPGAVPGDYGKIGPERVRAPSEAPTKDAKWITGVSQPTLTVFRPPEDKNTGTAVIICPGGGYWNLAWDLEGEEVAAWLNTVGVTAFVLKYRVPRRAGQPERLPPPGPLLDAQRAVSIVRSRAAEWGIHPERIGIAGFSAGGHLAVITATRFDERAYETIDEIDHVSCRPDFAIAVYPGYFVEQNPAGRETNAAILAPYMRIPKGTPPIFLVHASDDSVAGAENSLVMYHALQRANVPAELHLYAQGRHGFGVRKGNLPCSRWTDQCVAWLQGQGLAVARPFKGQDDATSKLAPLPEGQSGIASRYPGDRGIERDPAVIFHDGFEENDLRLKWDNVFHQANIRIATEPENVNGGERALEFTVPQKEAEVSNAVVKRLKNGYDTIFLRFYSRFDPGFDQIGSSHNGGFLAAIAPGVPFATPGVRADGRNKFIASFECWRADARTPSPGELNVYCYHPEQRDVFGDHFFPSGKVLPFSSRPGEFGPEFVGRPDISPELGRWYCFEFMLRANTVGKRDGRISCWVDGKLTADFPNLRLRDVDNLKINFAALDLHIKSNKLRPNKKWYDDVVIATTYIGPISGRK